MIDVRPGRLSGACQGVYPGDHMCCCPGVHDYEQLNVWRDAHLLAKDTYRITEQFPEDERYGMSAQMRRAAVSVPANIAEGAGRRTDGDFRRFVAISAGSSSEVEYYALLACELGWIESRERDDIRRRVRSIRRRLYRLAESLSES